MFLRQTAARFEMFVTAGLLLALPLQSLDAKPLPGELAGTERTVRLNPASPWQLQLADDRCRLARRFESTKGPGMVLIEQIAPGQRFDLTIAGPDFARARRGNWFYGGMRSDLEMVTINPLEYEIAGYDNAILLGGISIDDDLSPEEDRQSRVAAVDPAAADLVERIVLQRSTTIVSFETGNMKAPLEALNACSHDLLLEWGLDAEAHSTYHRPPKMPDERLYFRRLHHKLTSTPGNEGHKSLLRVRAIVTSEGSVTNCHHEYALSSGGLEPDVCQDIKDMQFDPATDRDGKPMASVYSLSLTLSQYDPWTADAHGGRWGSD